MRVRARDLVLIPLTLVITIVGLVWGGRNTYISVHNRTPLALTCAEYLAKRPVSRWLVLRECDADWDHIAIEGRVSTTSPGTVTSATAVYIPLRPAGTSRTEPATLVLHADSGLFLELGGAFPREQVVDAIGVELQRPLEGVVELAIDRSERRKERLRRLDLRVVDEFVTFDHGARPRPLWLALGALAVGLGGLGRIVWRVRRWRRSGPPTLPRATVHGS